MVRKSKKSVAQITAAVIAATLAMSIVTVPAQSAETTITRDVTDFDKIRLMGKFAGTVIVGENASLTITGKGDLEARVVTEVKGDELHVRLTKKKRHHDTLVLAISTKELEKFIVEGAGDFTITGIDSDDFEVRLPGAAKLSLAGRCEDLAIIIAGAAHVDGKDLKCENGRVRISGTGTISVYTSEEIDARVSGLGKISVYGKPSEIDQHISGLGKIKLH